MTAKEVTATADLDVRRGSLLLSAHEAHSLRATSSFTSSGVFGAR